MNDKKRKLYNSEEIHNFKELIERYKNLYSEKVAFKYKLETKSKEYVEVTYSKFVSDIEKLGTALINLGLTEKRVAIIAPNRYEWCVSYLAITTSNMVVVPLDKSLPPNEIEALIKRSSVEAVIFDKEYLDVFKKIFNDNNINTDGNQKNTTNNNFSNLKYLICIDNLDDINSTNNLDNSHNLEKDFCLFYSNLISNGENLLNSGDSKYKNTIIDNNKMAIMLFTSGTTAISKAVSLSQSNICADIYALSQMAKVTKDDTFLSFLPLHHTFESSCTFLYGTYCGITIAFCDGIRHVASNLKEYNITGFVCVPLMLEMMYKKINKAIEEQGKTNLVKRMASICNFLLKFGIDIRKKVFKQIINNFAPNLRILIAGGASMNKDAINGFLNLGINLLQGYGLTETSPVLAGENDKYKRLGSVGFALPGIEIQIDSPNKDGIGEIKAKGPTIMLGYHENPEATSEVLKDGWFYTGDLGYIDKDGFLFITGRKKDVIVLKNGKNIYPEELEILVNALPYVVESMVYGKSYSRKSDVTKNANKELNIVPSNSSKCHSNNAEDLYLCCKIVYNKDIMHEMFKDSTSEQYHDIIWNDIRNNINKSMPSYKYIKEITVTDIPLIKTTTQKIKRHEEISRL